MIATLYARFRGSVGFLYALCALIFAAVFCHRFLGYDPDWGLTNLCLSMEASVSVALLIMQEDRQRAAEERQQEKMLHLMEAQAASNEMLLMLARKHDHE